MQRHAGRDVRDARAGELRHRLAGNLGHRLRRVADARAQRSLVRTAAQHAQLDLLADRREADAIAQLGRSADGPAVRPR